MEHSILCHILCHCFLIVQSLLSPKSSCTTNLLWLNHSGLAFLFSKMLPFLSFQLPHITKQNRLNHGTMCALFRVRDALQLFSSQLYNFMIPIHSCYILFIYLIYFLICSILFNFPYILLMDIE